MYHNIDKHPTRKGVYIGYAAGAWHVRKGDHLRSAALPNAFAEV